MERSARLAELKNLLVAEVNRLFRHDGRLWKEPIVDVLQSLRDSSVQAVVFGGTLRSLLISRLYDGRPGRPRDVDLVVSGIPFEQIEKQFERLITRRTRFGGLQLKRKGWQFDIWPIGSTWALQNDVCDPAFPLLPSTTPFNLEAVAVEAWPQKGRPRAVFSGDDQFFEGVLSRTLELNRADNPFPALTVVRALVIASELRFRIGPRLAAYIAVQSSDLNANQLDELQLGHYGQVRIGGRTLRALADWVIACYGRADLDFVALPALGQLPLWPLNENNGRVHIYLVDTLAAESEGKAERSAKPMLESTIIQANGSGRSTTGVQIDRSWRKSHVDEGSLPKHSR